LLILSYYGYQNWRSRRAWRNFQAGLKQRGETVDLALLLPKRVPDDMNFARTPAFLDLLSKTNRSGTNLFARVMSLSAPVSPMGLNNILMDWNHQANLSLANWTGWGPANASLAPQVATRVPPGYAVNMPRPPNQSPPQPGGIVQRKRVDDAATILQALQPRDEALHELAIAALRLPSFQVSTNCEAVPAHDPSVVMLERLHLLFQIRACAALAVGKGSNAAEDVLVGLHLANLARQIPDSTSTMRVQVMLMRSLQPLWEGLNRHDWTEPQLASFQRELTGLNLLADYTNAIRRVVLANIQIWSAIPDSTNSDLTRLVPNLGGMNERARRWQPRAWWFDNCLHLYNASLSAIEQVDLAAGRVQQGVNWSELQGLPLDSETQQLLQQTLWWGVYPGSVAFAQTSVNQALTACALERFHLAHGAYPQTLEQLVPELLTTIPHDAVSGRPIIYQPPENGTFILRGVGPNGRDDRTSQAPDDWLWTYGTNRPAAKPKR
jgi:hypothetical protein